MKGPFSNLPQPPRNRNGVSPFEMSKWLDAIWLMLTGMPGIPGEMVDMSSASIPADRVDLSKAKLSDIGSRPHVQLQNVYGADETNSGAIIQNPNYVKHVSDEQAKRWSHGAEAADQAQALLWM